MLAMLEWIGRSQGQLRQDSCPASGWPSLAGRAGARVSDRAPTPWPDAAPRAGARGASLSRSREYRVLRRSRAPTVRPRACPAIFARTLWLSTVEQRTSWTPERRQERRPRVDHARRRRSRRLPQRLDPSPPSDNPRRAPTHGVAPGYVVRRQPVVRL